MTPGGISFLTGNCRFYLRSQPRLDGEGRLSPLAIPGTCTKPPSSRHFDQALQQHTSRPRHRHLRPDDDGSSRGAAGNDGEALERYGEENGEVKLDWRSRDDDGSVRGRGKGTIGVEAGFRARGCVAAFMHELRSFFSLPSLPRLGEQTRGRDLPRAEASETTRGPRRTRHRSP